MTGEIVKFNSIEDVHLMFEKVYDDSISRSVKKLGESVYMQGAFFYDLMLFVDQDYQDRIKEFSFCKSFNCSPYSSLQETPENLIEDFLTIEAEFNSIKDHKQRKQDGDK